MKPLESVKEFAFIAFTLLGVLFGMMIMSFVFGFLGPNSIPLTDDTFGVTNLSDVYINVTNYTITQASSSLFKGGFTVISVYNSTELVPAANYTVNAATGVITSATVFQYHNVNMSYTYNFKSGIEQDLEQVQNNSMEAIVTYSEGADTQFSTLTIAIILGLLIAVFLIFWKIFVSKKGAINNSGGSFG